LWSASKTDMKSAVVNGAGFLPQPRFDRFFFRPRPCELATVILVLA